MLRNRPLALGDLRGTIYDFEAVGDVLESHAHDAATLHISIVLKGSFRVHGDGWEHVAASGNVLDWVLNQLHGFVALEPGSCLMNIQKKMAP